jgi:hypothetical protein
MESTAATTEHQYPGTASPGMSLTFSLSLFSFSFRGNGKWTLSRGRGWIMCAREGRGLYLLPRTHGLGDVDRQLREKGEKFCAVRSSGCRVYGRDDTRAPAHSEMSASNSPGCGWSGGPTCRRSGLLVGPRGQGGAAAQRQNMSPVLALFLLFIFLFFSHFRFQIPLWILL